MRGVLPIAVLCTLLAASVLFAQAPVAVQAVERGISVSGSSEVFATPDIARVTLGARTRADTAQKAAQDNSAALQKIMQALSTFRIPHEDIQTVQYTVQPVFEYPQNREPVIIGYEAINLVRITVRDLNQVGPVIDAAVGAGANVVQDIAFALADESKVRAQAITRAVQDGRAKAEVIAQALNIQLGRVISADEVGAPIVTPVFARVEAAGGGTPVSPGQIVIRATVNLLYAIGR